MGHDLPGQLDGLVRLLADAPSKLIGLASHSKARFGGLFFAQSLPDVAKNRLLLPTWHAATHLNICLCPSRASHAPRF
jgi:hypothetical protein